ncbi:MULTISPECIES: hypothetical protein [Streptomyces]|uniref:Uncharacterized protein n=2 Tax=Streptomyces TaxID=1883 RepID=A0ABW7VNA2_STROI|nr:MULTISPECIES: hypothetical protein [Streptomyces]GHA76318.1 hypothetical protein GCM10010345_92910 [Streptomyces canarius]
MQTEDQLNEDFEIVFVDEFLSEAAETRSFSSGMGSMHCDW